MSDATASGAARGGLHIRLIRANGEVVDFGEAIQGDEESIAEQARRIAEYNATVEGGD